MTKINKNAQILKLTSAKLKALGSKYSPKLILDMVKEFDKWAHFSGHSYIVYPTWVNLIKNGVHPEVLTAITLQNSSMLKLRMTITKSPGIIASNRRLSGITKAKALVFAQKYKVEEQFLKTVDRLGAKNTDIALLNVLFQAKPFAIQSWMIKITNPKLRSAIELMTPNNSTQSEVDNSKTWQDYLTNIIVEHHKSNTRIHTQVWRAFFIKYRSSIKQQGQTAIAKFLTGLLDDVVLSILFNDIAKNLGKVLGSFGTLDDTIIARYCKLPKDSDILPVFSRCLKQDAGIKDDDKLKALFNIKWVQKNFLNQLASLFISTLFISSLNLNSDGTLIIEGLQEILEDSYWGKRVKDRLELLLAKDSKVLLAKLEKFVETLPSNKVLYAYHRTKSIENIANIKENGFVIGSGAMYGPGIYATYHVNSQLNEDMIRTYGGYMVRCKIKLQNFVVFDKAIAKKIYGINYSTKQHCQTIVPNFTVSDESFTSTNALKFMNIVQEKFSRCTIIGGIIFTGRRDGNVIVVFDPKLVTPVEHAQIGTTIPKNIKWSLDTHIEEATVKNFKYSQSIDVYELVAQKKMKLSDAIREVLGPIKDGSGPKPAAVADEVLQALRKR